MTDMQQAMRTRGHLPQNVIIKNPAGTYSFVGRVSARLAYVTKDGYQPTTKQFQDAASFGPRLVGLRSRTWPTEEAARKALALENLRDTTT